MTEYTNPIPVVSCAILNKNRILLLKRAIEPFPGKWALPAGHVEPGESAEESIIREVKEETSLDIDVHYMFSMGRHLDDGRAFLSLTFVAHTEQEQISIDHESLDWKWVEMVPTELENVDWAFQNHKKAAVDLSPKIP